MSHDYEFLNDLNEKQKFVCIDANNFIVTACPGSGKTRTIVHRLAYLSTRYRESRLLNIAITYTNRAADEVENRLLEMGISNENVWSGTIHQFCLNFILRPYSMYHEKLNKGFKIIDEFIKEKYVIEIANDIGKEGYVGNFYTDKEIMLRYNELIEQKKEVDFDKILKYSFELVDRNSFIALNIGHLIRSIHVDEFQDTNELQYLILSKLIKSNTRINIVFVGDVNQAIFTGLGGVAKSADEIKELFSVDFTEICLDGCYRSTQRIVDYYVNYEVNQTNVKSVAKICYDKSCITYNKNIQKEELASVISGLITTELDKGVPEHEICVVAPQWYQIFPIAKKMREMLPKSNFDAPDISPFKYDPFNIFFLIAKLLFTKDTGNRYMRRKNAKEIMRIIKDDYNLCLSDQIINLDVLKAINETTYITDDGLKTLEMAIDNVFSMFGIQMSDEMKVIYNEFFNKAKRRIENNHLDCSCGSIVKSFMEKKGIVITSIHQIKGEEYTTVIAFDLLNGHLPHSNYLYDRQMIPFRKDEANKLLYVLCSRAKKNLFLFSETGRTTQKGKPLTPTDEIATCCFEYD